MSNNHELPPQVLEALLGRESLALVGRLLKGLAHNIFGAMQMIRLPLDLMELDLAKGDAASSAKKIAVLQDALDRLQRELDLIGAKSSQQTRPDDEPFDLWSLAKEHLEFWTCELFFKHQVELTVDLPPSNGMVKEGEHQADLAFNLLLANAVESLTGAGGEKMVVRGRKTPDGPGLLIWDEGPDPQGDVRKRMFEAFFTTKDGSHSGLGLFLAREALQKRGGGLTWLPGEDGGFLMHLPGP